MRYFLLLIPFVLQATFLNAQKSFDESLVFTDKVLSEITAREDIVGTSITIGLADSILFSKGYGLADRELKVPTQDYHKFRIYSLSKHITAIAAAKLHEDGLLDLDKKIIEYIPFLDENLHMITSRQLIGHIAGIRAYKDEEWQKVSNSVCITPFESIISFQNDPLEFKPGEAYSYTSFGYVLLSAVIEKVSGQPFMEYLEESFFKPLKLNITLDNADEIDNLTAKPYEYWKGTMYNARYANNTCKFGGGGFSASSKDVVLFNLAVHQGKVLNQESLNMVMTSMRLNNGDKTNYGFGLQYDTDAKGRYYAWHSGRSRGGRNALVIYPKKKLVVCISANTNGDGIVEEAESIAQSVLNEMEKN
ncbi:serine hydrolase domain-containing protein [Robiginitalea sp. IMCC43444]|uniref:serine hydrolase domain-containing protein n=1 Tax=Robiginitalea sp. IMCC43444 TaxID=3459121 RepID=UPI0040422F2D